MVIRGIALVLVIGTVFSAEKPLILDCSIIYNSTVSFSAKQLELLNISIPNSHNSSIRINSPCCEQIQPNDVNCGPCLSGEKECFVNQSEVIDLSTNIGQYCLNETEYYFTCHAQLCNGTFPPGYETTCFNKDDTYQICLNDGSWMTSPCTNGHRQTVQSTSISPKIPPRSTIKKATTKQRQLVTTTFTPFNSGGQSSTINSLEGTTIISDNDSSTVSSLDDGQVRKDLVNFLIALGVVMVVVFIIVCGFFVRKAKRKENKNDFSLEYWQETDLIESICGKGSCSINPIHNDVNGQGKPNQRYIKKGDNTCFHRGSLTDKDCGITTSTGIVDVPRRMKHNYTDKYVTTATGSNFYSYRTSPDVDLGETGGEQARSSIRMERRDVDKIGSFKPRYSKKQPKSRKTRPTSELTSDDARVNMPESDDVYAVSYKNKIKDSLDYWSAEESDV